MLKLVAQNQEEAESQLFLVQEVTTTKRGPPIDGQPNDHASSGTPDTIQGFKVQSAMNVLADLLLSIAASKVVADRVLEQASRPTTNNPAEGRKVKPSKVKLAKNTRPKHKTHNHRKRKG